MFYVPSNRGKELYLFGVVSPLFDFLSFLHCVLILYTNDSFPPRLIEKKGVVCSNGLQLCSQKPRKYSA